MSNSALSLGAEVMDREPAPRRIGGLRAPFQRVDEIAMVELDLEGYAREILGGKLERGLRQVDAVIVLDLGRTKSLLHLAGIAAGNIEKGEGLRDRLQRLVEDPSDLLVGERIAIDQLLVSRPLLSGIARERPASSIAVPGRKW